MITQPTFTIDDFYTELANHRDSHGNRLDIIKREDYRNDKHPDNGLLYVEAAYYSPRRAANGVNLIYTIASTPLTSSGVIFFKRCYTVAAGVRLISTIQETGVRRCMITRVTATAL